MERHKTVLLNPGKTRWGRIPSPAGKRSDPNGTYLTRATPNDVQLATGSTGKNTEYTVFFPCLPCDSVAIYHAWAIN
jgi:hypothetical protein